VLNNKIVLVGDDIPWLVEINDDFTIAKKTQLSGIDSIVNGRTPYQLKADYECMETFSYDGAYGALILSSGSKVDLRDTAVLITFRDTISIVKKNMRPLFEKIKLQAELKEEEINIEGIAITERKIYLLHRGNISGNFIAEFDKTMFLEYIQTGQYLPSGISIYPFSLPELNGVQSGFSGACYYADEQYILFTASMEDTESVTADGEVSGSYIGFIPLNTLEEGIYHSALLEKDGEILAKKLEGIAVKNADGNKMEILSICDNDDGTSDLFLINMSIIND